MPTLAWMRYCSLYPLATLTGENLARIYQGERRWALLYEERFHAPRQ
jgi:hypothetical protein